MIFNAIVALALISSEVNGDQSASSSSRPVLTVDLPVEFPAWLPPLIKHRENDEVTVNLALIARLIEYSPAALTSVANRPDALGRLMQSLTTLTQLDETCVADMLIFLQTAIDAIVDGILFR